MFQLIYSSIESRTINVKELHDILEIARKVNSSKGITGLLFYIDGTFIQLLEGEKEIVLNLYEKIKNDYRHKDITTIIEVEDGRRLFPDWSMGFKSIHSTDIKNFEGEKVTPESLRSNCLIFPNMIFDLMATFVEK